MVGIVLNFVLKTVKHKEQWHLLSNCFLVLHCGKLYLLDSQQLI